MKYALAFTLYMFTSLVWAIDYQQVIEYPGSTQQILNAVNGSIGAVTSKHIAGDTLTAQVKIRCMTGMKWLPVPVPLEGSLVVEARDGRYRVTFDKMRNDSGWQLKELQPSFREECQPAFQKFVEELNNRMKNYKDF